MIDELDKSVPVMSSAILTAAREDMSFALAELYAKYWWKKSEQCEKKRLVVLDVKAEEPSKSNVNMDRWL